MNHKGLISVMGSVIIIFALLQITLGISENYCLTHIVPIILVFILFLFVAIHGSLRYGVKGIIVFFLITSSISFGYENISILTGFPFGDYHYSNNLGFKLLYVPLVIMPAYFSGGYLSWTIAQIILNEYKNRLSGWSTLLVPLVATFIMVMWNISFEPFMSTIHKNWIWENGGAFFGVPFANYSGWFLCMFTVYMVFSLYLWKYEKDSPLTIINQKYYWIQSVAMYALLPTIPILKVFFSTEQFIRSLDGYFWKTSDIYFTATLFTIFTIYFVSILAIISIAKKRDSIGKLDVMKNTGT